MKKSYFVKIFACFMFVSILSGCDYLGIESQKAIEDRKNEQAKAIGAACRHSARALEDCFLMHPKVSKAGIFSGWKEMDQYMRDNNIQPVKAEIPVEAPDQAENKKEDKVEQSEDKKDDTKKKDTPENKPDKKDQ